jgi:DNA-binding transcriptional regulator PaaX
MKEYGILIGKILGILANGFVLSVMRDKRKRIQLYRECDRLWYTIDRKQLSQVLKRLRLNNFLFFEKQIDGSEKAYLTPSGQTFALKYQFRNLVIKKPRNWDKKWRIVLFDIPEEKRKIRDALRKKIKRLGFLEFQKSVFIFPYPCPDEINFVINFWDIHNYVYYLEAPILPDLNFRKHFKLN